ncbi:MAG: SEC-C domain-containing protein [Clostridia bacterium]|nr:SEC-C domain-containing protein [Clostridia bacterium]
MLNGILTMELPNEDIRKDMLAQLAELKKEMPTNSPAPAKKVKVGRNDPCPCGSGKKYKKCCGK